MIHNVSYRTFVYGTEDEEKVVSALTHIFPTILPEKDITFPIELLFMVPKTKKR